MNHPTKEELVSLLYDDLSVEQKAQLDAHVAGCPECQGQMQRWGAVQKDLEKWQIGSGKVRRAVPFPVIRWAAAAALFLLVGFGIGRSQNHGVDLNQLKAELESKLEARISQEIAAVRSADRKQFIAMLRDVEEQRISDYSQLRKDLETVAVVADEKLATTERALTQLHLIAQTGNPTSSQ